MRFTLHLLLAIGIALVVGFALSYYALSTPRFFGGYQYGAWTTWPAAGSPDPDPYTRAHLARSGLLQLGRSEGMAFHAETDGEGRPLSTACTYRLEGRTPAAALWTLVATDQDGRNIIAEDNQVGFDSRHIAREPDGSMVIRVSKTLAPGNWMQIGGQGKFILVLTLYDADVFTGLGSEVPTLPDIVREGCTS